MPRLVEKPIENQYKSFGRAFSKARRVEGQRPSSLPAGSEITCLHQKSAKEEGIGGGKTRVFSPPIINLSYICFKCSLKEKILFRQTEVLFRKCSFSAAERTKRTSGF